MRSCWNKIRKFFKKQYEYIAKTMIWSIIIFFAVFFLGKKFSIKDNLQAITEHIYEFVLLLILMIIIFRKSLWKLLKDFVSKYINMTDSFLTVMTLVSILLYFEYRSKENVIELIVVLLFVIIRIIIYASRHEKDQYESNIIWLHEAYDRELCNKYRNKVQVLIRDEPADRDLLDKELDVSAIVSAIENCNPDNTFFIGLDGKWNSGKSTIIKLVNDKLKNKEIYIVKFDPCKYDDCENMLKGFYDSIAKKVGISGYIKYKESIKSLIKEVLSKEFDEKVFNTLSNEIFSKYDVNNMINNQLEKSNKRLLIIVDNLDRADIEILNFFLRCTYAVAKLKRTIFFLVYDSEVLNTQLGTYYNTNNLFMSKIVNLPIIVPKVDETKINKIFYTCVNNLKENRFIEEIVDNKGIDFYGDFREIIRALNYLICYSRNIKKLRLNMYDLLGLLYIKEHEPLIYDKIYSSRTILTYGQEYDFSINKKREDKVIKAKINKLYNEIKNDKCKSIVRHMFSIINNCVKNSNIVTEKLWNIKGNCIENHHYFRMYFHMNNNKYSDSYNNIENQIESFNEIKVTKETYVRFFQKYILDEDDVACRGFVVGTIRDEFFDSFDYYLVYLACLDLIDENVEPSTYLYGIIYDSINRMNNDMKNVKKNAENDYKNLWLYWRFSHPDIVTQNKSEVFDKIVIKLCDAIADEKNKINLLSNEYYIHSNMYVLKEKIGEEKTNKMLSNWINEKTVINYIRYCICVCPPEDEGFCWSHKNKGDYNSVKQSLKKINMDSLDEQTRERINFYLKTINDDKYMIV